jgi:hypothetical protein
MFILALSAGGRSWRVGPGRDTALSTLRTPDGWLVYRVEALHLGVQKALGVVASHYQVDFEAVSTGYVVPDGVDDETAINHVHALATPATDMLAEDFTDFLFPNAPAAVGPQA